MSSVLVPAAGQRFQRRRQGGTAAVYSHRQAIALGAALTLCYVAVSVAVWWRVWTGHPTSDLTCGCGDPALFVWSFGWMAHAVAHGDNPFFTTTMFHPQGVNLLANTTVPLLGVVLAPVTWIFGPIASLNVANTLAPALSALATYWAVRRCLRVGRWGALVAGLLVEISPALVVSGSASHLQVSMLAFVPLVGVCLYELLVRQGGPPWRWGAALAAALVGQFFTGTEMLAVVGMVGAAGVAVAVTCLAVSVARGSSTAWGRARHAVRGLAVAGVAGGAVLAYPLWFALAGPRHTTGAPWPGLLNGSGDSLRGVVSTGDIHGTNPLLRLGGYLGPAGAPMNYLGVAAVLAAVVSVVVFRRRPEVWFLATVAVAFEWLSLGGTWLPDTAQRPAWVPFLPWAAIGRLPVLGNILALNFSLVTLLAVAALVGLLVDRLCRAGRGWLRVLSAAGGVVVSAAVLMSLATAWVLPLTVVPAGVPAWFVQDAPHLPAGSVVLAYPFGGPPGDSEALVWQSVDRMHFALAGGCCLVPGPTGRPDHGTTPGSAEAILGALSSTIHGPLPPLTDSGAMATVRRAMDEWGVTHIVVTDRGRDPAYTIRWFAGLLGRSPSDVDGASVWTVTAADRAG